MKVELKDQNKTEFLRILKVLNHYYEMKGERDEFRKSLESISEDQIILEVSKLGKFEYQVTASVKDGESQTWIHIDGISEERERFAKFPEHPVFSLTSMGDLFESAIPKTELSRSL